MEAVPSRAVVSNKMHPELLRSYGLSLIKPELTSGIQSLGATGQLRILRQTGRTGETPSPSEVPGAFAAGVARTAKKL